MKNIFLFLFLFFGIYSQAQPATYFRIPQPRANLYGFANLSTPDSGYIGIDKGPLALKLSGYTTQRTITLLKFDSHSSLVKQIPLAGGEKVFSSYYTDIKKAGGKYWFLYMEAPEGHKIGNIMAREVDPITLEMDQPRILVPATDMEITPKYIYVEPQVQLKTSPDGKQSAMLISLNLGQVVVIGFDHSMKPLWTKRDTIGSYYESLRSVTIDNEARVYVSYLKEKTCFIRRYTQNGLYQNMPVNLDGPAPSELILQVLKNDQVVLCGTYTRNDYTSVGVYQTFFIDDGRLEKFRMIDFPDSLVRILARDSWGSTKSKKYGLTPSCHIRIIEMPDGTVSMVVEFKADPHYSNQSGDLLVISLNKGKGIFARIPKYSVDYGGDQGD
ncbi:MAG: hypothetical protein ACJ75J_15035, partial [Cytophagaceae bacterium]